MNILSEEVVREAKKRLGGKPSLEKVWEEIKRLQSLYESCTESKLWKRVDIQSREGQELIKKTVFCLVEELFELTNSLKNRLWTQTQYEVDLPRLYDELADAAIFFVILAHQLHLDPESFLEIVMRKIIVNKFRVRSGY